MAEQRPIGDQVVAILREARGTRTRLFDARRDAHEASGKYGWEFPRLVGGAMLRYQANGEMPGRESVLDMLRTGAGFLLSRAEQFALEQAERQLETYDAEVEASVRSLLDGTEVTVTPREGVRGLSVYHQQYRGGGGTRGGLGMPDTPLTGNFAGLNVADSRLHIATPDLPPEYECWTVNVLSDRGRQMVDLSVTPLPTESS